VGTAINQSNRARQNLEDADKAFDPTSVYKK
jgi:hypothetical protein